MDALFKGGGVMRQFILAISVICLCAFPTPIMSQPAVGPSGPVGPTYSPPTGHSPGPSRRESKRPRRESKRQRQSTAAYEKGVEYYKNKDYDNAIKYFEESLRLDPRTTTYGPRTTREYLQNAYNEKGDIYYMKGDYDNAIKYYYKGNDARPNVRKRGADISDAEQKKKEQKEAEQRRIKDQRLEAEKQRVKEDERLARQRQEEKDRIEEQKLKEAKQKVNNMLGGLAKKFAASTGTSKSSGLSLIGSPSRLFEKGTKNSAPVVLRLIPPDKPLTVEDSLRDAPTEIQWGKDIEDNALVLWKTNDLEGAEKAYRKQLIQLENDPQRQAGIKLLLSQVLHEKGDDTAAMKLFNEATQIAPDHPLVQLMYAKDLDESGDRQGAVKVLRKFISTQPDNKAAVRVLAEMERGQVEGSIKSGLKEILSEYVDRQRPGKLTPYKDMIPETRLGGAVSTPAEPGKAAIPGATASGQAKTTEFHSKRASKQTGYESIKSEASRGFVIKGSPKKGLAPLELKDIPAYEQDPDIKDHQKTPEIKKLVKQRTQTRKKRKALEKKLKHIMKNPQKNAVKIAETKQQISNAQNKEMFFNYSINQKSKKQLQPMPLEVQPSEKKEQFRDFSIKKGMRK